MPFFSKLGHIKKKCNHFLAKKSILNIFFNETTFLNINIETLKFHVILTTYIIY